MSDTRDIIDARASVPADPAAFVAPTQTGYVTTLDIMLDERLFAQAERMARIMAGASGVTPQHLVGKPEACFAVVTRAIGWRLDPFAVAQCTYQTPGGRIGYEGKLCQAILEASGRLSGGVTYELYGDWSKIQGAFTIEKSQKGNDYARPAWRREDEKGVGVIVRAHIKGRDEVSEMRFDLSQAHPRNSTLWALDPQTQIKYTAVRRFASTVAAVVFMGVPFDHEDEGDAHRGPDTAINVTPRPVAAAPTSRLGGFAAGAAPAAQVVEADAPPMEPDPDAFWARVRDEGRYDFRGRSAKRWAEHAAVLAGAAPDLDELAAFRAANGPKMRDLPAALRDELAAALDNIAASYATDGAEDDDFPGDAA